MAENYIVYVCDTETTGLIPGTHEIIELSLYRLDLENPDNNDQKTWLVRALKPDTIQDEALAVSGHLREDILCLTKTGKDTYKHPLDVVASIESWIGHDDMSANDRVLAGQNIIFDYEHMEHLWKSQGSYDTFPFTTGYNKLLLDTKLLTIAIDICVGKKRSQYSLGSLIKAFGIKKEKAHRADADVRMTKDLLVKYLNVIKPVIKEAFVNNYNEA
jgi:DNA polymerase III alpha subunit (gram-positive type)